jgi:hypothetical protein
MTRKLGSAALTLSVLWAVVSLVLRGGVGVSLATAGPPSQTNFTRDFQIACLDSQFFVDCEYVALLAQTFVTDTNTSEFDQIAIQTFPRVLVLSDAVASCEDCVTEVELLEADMATNQTAENIAGTLNQACKKENPTVKKNCAAQAAAVPSMVEEVLSNDPPLTACNALGLCP